MLVNKFRGKYQIDIDDQSGLIRLVRAEVGRFLDSEQMTEANLVNLDKRLGEIVTSRVTAGNPTASRGASNGLPALASRHGS